MTENDICVMFPLKFHTKILKNRNFRLIEVPIYFNHRTVDTHFELQHEFCSSAFVRVFYTEELLHHFPRFVFIVRTVM